MRLFDKIQKIFLIVGIASFVLSIIFLIWNSATATPIYDEVGKLVNYEYQKAPQTLYSITVYLNILCVAWFIVRLITFNMRLKEAEKDNKIY